MWYNTLAKTCFVFLALEFIKIIADTWNSGNKI